MEFLKSKKLLVLAVGAAVVAFADVLGYGDVAKQIVPLMLTYLVGQSVVDVTKK